LSAAAGRPSPFSFIGPGRGFFIRGVFPARLGTTLSQAVTFSWVRAFGFPTAPVFCINRSFLSRGFLELQSLGTVAMAVTSFSFWGVKTIFFLDAPFSAVFLVMILELCFFFLGREVPPSFFGSAFVRRVPVSVQIGRFFPPLSPRVFWEKAFFFSFLYPPPTKPPPSFPTQFFTPPCYDAFLPHVLFLPLTSSLEIPFGFFLGPLCPFTGGRTSLPPFDAA